MSDCYWCGNPSLEGKSWCSQNCEDLYWGPRKNKRPSLKEMQAGIRQWAHAGAIKSKLYRSSKIWGDVTNQDVFNIFGNLPIDKTRNKS